MSQASLAALGATPKPNYPDRQRTSAPYDGKAMASMPYRNLLACVASLALSCCPHS